MGASKKPAAAGLTSKAEREADLVMGTNNSSIVSKRSVELLYYPKPHFFRYFVKKPQRRSPLINRGYWLRMHAMEETVRQFMSQPSDKPKFVLNLGCGFDPLPFILLSADKSLCSTTQFVDIDYEKLMINKKTAIRRTDEITQLLENVEFLSDESPIQIRSEKYIGVGCDLKNLKKLDDVLRTEVLPSECSILFLAEVSLTYMDVKSANAVLDWASKLNDDAKFCILEQFFPDGPNHPFASTMMKHFNKLGAPLYSIHEYPSLSEQEQRFRNAGWKHAHARSLWDLWSDDEFVGTSRRAWLDSVEPFDEWEEFALFASHYFLLIASTKPQSADQDPAQAPVSAADTDASFQYMLLPSSSQGAGHRRFGALIPDSEKSIGHHSGLCQQTRDASTDLYTKSREITSPELPFPSREVSARMCHTVTSLGDADCLLVGGRASPASGFQDCWLRQGSQWRSVQNLPAPRFRHSAVKLSLDSDSEVVLVYGGKSSDGSIFDNWLMWRKDGAGWQEIETQGSKPTARFGACLATINDTTGVLFGGIGPSGNILEDFWTWKMHQRDDGSIYVELIEHTDGLRRTSPLCEYIYRFGATITMTSWGLVIAGGIIPRHVVPYRKEIMLLDSTTLLKDLNDKSPWSQNIVSAIGLGDDLRGPRPLLVGHASCAVEPGQVLMLGGGAVCFSFGTFWTEGSWILQSAASACANDWALVPETVQAKKPVVPQVTPHIANCSATKEIPSIPRRRVENPEQFQQILADGRPVIIEGSDIGPCTERWTKEYLTEAVGSDRKVIVHEAQSDNMDFQSKNFSYVTKPFGEFLNQVHAGGRQYLRSISSEQPSKLPANLAVDFPGLKDDFQLSEALSLVTENAHSSPLRISGPVTMWLHYDVMANVLCQIRGKRRLVLFPPRDVQYLQIPPGGSSSTINVFPNMEDGSIISIPHTSPQETVLNSGDILFIPPMWLHTASPIGEVSVAVNVFFRNLSKGYAAGRDVYGNRDLQAYEKARADLQKMVKSFDGLPADVAGFYLSRLAQELKESAEV
ncbi:tRNA methyltransferase PPM2 [Aspergillus clavatus NRRL 1]|uniref:tRNA wybutosine-synthesizing protein 4 n=1 Tax=Aspergillus clavatus (strain ATCC 1007 / CBS 513.65 / DSM 816 / NCTC 3887 / NRRL 1 / QM 1276 / 107) TaxID=344612 RepID=A1CBB9_ASPCL|nr:leucine carboxyl methyltransferase [Aspergillus clavatus NRRL 1]EAW13037.1 leucine carboxyl methyltransferase [Aspergillus clavatus NRRL 1]